MWYRLLPLISWLINFIPKVKHSAISFVIVVTWLCLGALFFYYIEHCYTPEPRPLAAQEAYYNQICMKILELRIKRTTRNSTKTMMNSMNSTTTTTTTTTATTHSNQTTVAPTITFNETERLLLHIAEHTMQICKDHPPEDLIRKCEMSLSVVWEWFDFTSSVAFTTGRNALYNKKLQSVNYLTVKCEIYHS